MTMTVQADLPRGQEFGTGSVRPRNPSKGSERKRKGAQGPLDRATMAAEYGYALRVIYSNDEIRNLFEQAVNDKTGQWTPTKFQAALHNTKWWTTNNEYARVAWAAEMEGTLPDGTHTADWQSQLDVAGQKLEAAAAKIGVPIDAATKAAMVHRYIYEGWADPNNAELMADALAEKIAPGAKGLLMGASGNLADDLRAAATANGLRLSDDYYLGAARSVAHGLTTADDWMRDVRSQAASLWPSWQDKIAGGVDAKSLASGYINEMAQTLELDANTIDLNDPTLRSAVTGVDEKGNPKMTGLADFRQVLRNDPRYLKTQQYTDDFSNIATNLMKMFGLQGGA